jgi:hypothetical protein
VCVGSSFSFYLLSITSARDLFGKRCARRKSPQKCLCFAERVAGKREKVQALTENVAMFRDLLVEKNGEVTAYIGFL